MATEAGHQPDLVIAPAATEQSPPPPPALETHPAAPPPVEVGAGPAEGLEAWSFFALIPKLEQLFPQAPAFGGTQDPNLERVRFRATPSLGYPAGEVDHFAWSEEDERLDVFINFLGVHGPSSPLPPYFTEQVIHDAADGGVLGTFYDLFNHRLASLLVRIQKQQRHYLRYGDGANDPISLAVASLIGLLPAIGDERRVSLMPYAGLLNSYTLSASIIATIIGHCTGLPVRIDEFVERIVTIPEQSQSRLGNEPPELGTDFIIGSSVVDFRGKFRVVIGPLDRDTFATVLPDRPAFQEVIRLIELALRDPLAFDIRLELEPGAPPPFLLGESRLGWNGWLEPTEKTTGVAEFAAHRFAAVV